jgi:hypothetical protein
MSQQSLTGILSMHYPSDRDLLLAAGFREILLTHGQATLVDADNYEWLSKYKWHAHWSERNHSYYARRYVRLQDGTSYSSHMHREILGLNRDDPRRGDHIHRFTLDNRRSELRVASDNQSAANRRGWSKSGMKGVHWVPRGRKWVARIRVDGQLIILGRFQDSAAACEAYKQAALLYFGEFACLSHVSKSIHALPLKNKGADSEYFEG